MARSRREIYDDLLVARCLQGDVQAWDELVRRWNDRLLYYIRRLINHEQDALNALQDVWLQAFRGVHILRDGSRLAPWLYIIARRTAMNYLRKSYALREQSSVGASLSEIDDKADDQLHWENAELVHYGLAKLNLPERELLTLFFLEDLTIGEIAELLGIPVGTVKSRLSKARNDLRRVLEKEDHRHDH